MFAVPRSSDAHLSPAFWIEQRMATPTPTQGCFNCTLPTATPFPQSVWDLSGTDFLGYVIVVVWQTIMLSIDYEPVDGAQRMVSSTPSLWGLLIRVVIFHIIAAGVLLGAAWITNAYTNRWWTKTLIAARMEEPDAEFSPSRDVDAWKVDPHRVRLLTRRRSAMRMASYIPLAMPRAVFENISEFLLVAYNSALFTFVTILATWHILLSYLMQTQWMKDVVWQYLAHYGLSGTTYTCFTAPFITVNITFLMGIYGLSLVACGSETEDNSRWEFPLAKLFTFYMIAGAYSIFIPNLLGFSVDRAGVNAGLSDPSLLPAQASRFWYLLGWKIGGAGVRGASVSLMILAIIYASSDSCLNFVATFGLYLTWLMVDLRLTFASPPERIASHFINSFAGDIFALFCFFFGEKIWAFARCAVRNNRTGYHKLERGVLTSRLSPYMK